MLDACQNCRFGNLGEGLNYGRGTGPGYWREPVQKVTFPRVPPTQFTPNETAWVAESPDMFYGLDGLGLTELSAERYQEDSMLGRIDPLPPTGSSTIFARADHDLVGPNVRWGTGAAQLAGLGQVRWPTAGRWSRGVSARPLTPTFAPRQRLAPMVSPASLARARKRQAALRALRRRRTAQIKAATKIQRAVARWR